MNQSEVTGWGTPQLSRIIEEGEDTSRRIDTPQYSPIQQPNFSQEADQQQQQMDRIQKEIGELGKQLQCLHKEMKEMQDKYSEEYLEKQGKRNSLRKKVIDLDYAHKCIFARRTRKNNANSIIHQFYNCKQTHNPTPPRSTEYLPVKDRNEATSQRINKFASPVKSTNKNKIEMELRTSERRGKGQRTELDMGQDILLQDRIQVLQGRQMLERQALHYRYGDEYLHSYYPIYGCSLMEWPY